MMDGVLRSARIKAKMPIRMAKHSQVGRWAPKASHSSPELITPINPMSPIKARMLPANTGSDPLVLGEGDHMGHHEEVLEAAYCVKEHQQPKLA